MGWMKPPLVFGRGTEVYMMAKVDSSALCGMPIPANVSIGDDTGVERSDQGERIVVRFAQSPNFQLEEI
jgi:hypothetical protein